MQRILSSLKILFAFTAIIFVSYQSFANDNNLQNKDRMWSRIERSSSTSNQKITSIPVQQSTEIRKSLLPHGMAVVYPNIAVHPSNASTQSELSIITHPTNPNIILGGSNAAENSASINWLSQGWYISTNGGTNWYGSDTLPPHLSNFANYTSDPAVAIDLNGNMYFNTLFYSASTGDLVTTKSTNNGATWSPFVAVPNTTTGEDKNHFTVDVNATSPYVNNLYTAYSDFGATPTRINFSRSTNGGTSFTAPVIISNGASTDQGLNLQVGPNGEVYGAWTSYITYPTNSNIGFNKSTDGGATWGTQVSAVSNLLDIRGTITKGGNSIRVAGFPSMAVDRSNGSHRGWIYVTYSAKPNGNPDVMFVRSTDGGTTWSTPKKISQESTNRDQWHPWAAVDQSTGSLYVMYYDSRNFSANDSAQVYLSRSLDGGDTFEDVLISDHAFLPNSIAGLASGYMGDYNSLTANNGMVYVFWNDNRSGHHQAYCSKVIFGPTIDHTPLGNTENTSGPYHISANVTSSGVALNASSVKLFWTRGTQFLDSVRMQTSGGNEFTANIPGNGHAADYRYYIQASDSLGGTSKSPAGAPNDYYAFSAATDTIPPSVTHTPLDNQFLETWPKSIEAEATDNIGIDSVWCEWAMYPHSKVGGYSGSFRMHSGEGDVYSGTFNTDNSQLRVGDTMRYVIYARDNGSGHLVGQTPIEGSNWFVFKADTTHPEITHSPLRNQPLIRWPASVHATVTDELGLSSVEVEWYHNIEADGSTFDLTMGENGNWSGTFDSDTNDVVVGDSVFYRIKAVDGSNNQNVTYAPEEGYYKFYIISTKGLVLVVDNDKAAASGFSKPGYTYAAKETIEVGGSSRLIGRTLTDLGYIVDTMQTPNIDTTTWDNYDIVVWSHGNSHTPANDIGWRNAMASRVLRGKSMIIEGGDIGWQYMSSTLDANFSTNVLHCADWVVESSTTLLNPSLKTPTHPLATTPNQLPASFNIPSTNVYDRDGNQPMPDAVSVYSWGGVDTLASVIAWDDTPNPIHGRVVYLCFNVNDAAQAESTNVKNLIENSADWLIGTEPPPTGSLSGKVMLKGSPSNAGATVHIKGPVRDEMVETDSSGNYSFVELYQGTYTVYAWKEGYYPHIDSLTVQVGTGPSENNNFAFVPRVFATISGTVTLSDTNNFAGITVQIVNQNLSTTTQSNGSYSLGNIEPGQVLVRYSKQGYGRKDTSVTLSNGGSAEINVTLAHTSGYILIINDDPTGASEKVKTEKGLSQTSPNTVAGRSANLFESTLTGLGFDVTVVAIADVDVTSLGNYEIVITSSGVNLDPLRNSDLRAALVDRAMSGGKIWVEGGEIGYDYRWQTTELDKNFRQVVLHDSAWTTDNSAGDVTFLDPSHPLFNEPNTLTPPISFVTRTSYADKDAMSLMPNDYNAMEVGSWSAQATKTSIILSNNVTNPLNSQIIFTSFAIGSFTDSTVAIALIENGIHFLLKPDGVRDRATGIPTQYSLEQNYPNPFNPVTTIRFGLPEESRVTLNIYNVLGQTVGTLTNGINPAGYQEVQWNAFNVSSGIYLYRIDASSTTSNKSFTKISKMILLK